MSSDRINLHLNVIASGFNGRFASLDGWNLVAAIGLGLEEVLESFRFMVILHSLQRIARLLSHNLRYSAHRAHLAKHVIVLVFALLNNLV